MCQGHSFPKAYDINLTALTLTRASGIIKSITIGFGSKYQIRSMMSA